MKRPREAHETQGRCRFCGVAYRWRRTRARRLKLAACPVCGSQLSQTTHLFRGPWIERAPLFDEARAAEIRRARPRL